jgi:phosphotriesterase-related protein
MVDMFVRDLTKGIGDSNIKAGILKCATDEPGFTPGVERVLRAAAQAHVETGAPISTHTVAGLKHGIEQQRLFESEGVDLTRVVIGHCGESTDIAYLEELMANGSYIGLDRFGGDALMSTQDRIDTLVTLCERGHADQIVLSHDTACFIDWLPEELTAPLENWNFLHLMKDIVPELKRRGVTDEQLDQMFVVNPSKVLGQV